MQEVICQFRRALLPSSEEDLELLDDEFKVNQMVRCKVYKIDPLMEPSVLQNNTLHKCFELVGENSKDPNKNSKAKAKFACKVGIDFRYQDRVAVRPDNTVVFEYRSFKFQDLKDMERLKVFDKSLSMVCR